MELKIETKYDINNKIFLKQANSGGILRAKIVEIIVSQSEKGISIKYKLDKPATMCFSLSNSYYSSYIWSEEHLINNQVKMVK